MMHELICDCGEYFGYLCPLHNKPDTPANAGLRPAVAVWNAAYSAYMNVTNDSPQAAAAVIEADREAVRAEQAAELARFRAALEAIADGEGDAQDIARQTLAGDDQ